MATDADLLWILGDVQQVVAAKGYRLVSGSEDCDCLYDAGDQRSTDPSFPAQSYLLESGVTIRYAIGAITDPSADGTVTLYEIAGERRTLLGSFLVREVAVDRENPGMKRLIAVVP